MLWDILMAEPNRWPLGGLSLAATFLNSLIWFIPVKIPGWVLAGLGSRSRIRLKKKQKPEPEPLGKKSPEPELKKLAGSLALGEDKKHRKLYFSYSSLGKILSFMVKKNYFNRYIFFCSFTLLVCGEKYILYFAVRAGCFWPLEAGAARKKYQEPEPETLGKKIRSRSRSRLKKKSGAGAAKKFARSPALYLYLISALQDSPAPRIIIPMRIDIF